LITEPTREVGDASVIGRGSSVVGQRRVASIAALAAVLFLVTILAPQRFDLSALVNAGSVLSDSTAVPPGLTIIRPGDGYDGQFSYRLALDPFTNERSAEGMSLDIPAYRQQRILYPVLAWAVSLGRSTLLAAALALVNVAAVATLAWLAARFSVLHGRSPLWGLALAALPSCIVALANDLGEIVLAASLVAAALALERRWSLGTALALTLAVLAHEHGLVLVLAVALVTLSAPELRSRGCWLTWLIPLSIFVALQAQLALVWGETPMRIAVGFLSSPFRGVSNAARYIIPPRALADVLLLGGFAYAAAFSGACVWALRTTQAHRAVCLGWVFASTLLVLGGGTVWESELSFWRAATVPLTLGSLVLLGSRARLAAPTLLLSGGFGLSTAVRLAWTAWHGGM
jgi:hypothetical protein